MNTKWYVPVGSKEVRANDNRLICTCVTEDLAYHIVYLNNEACDTMVYPTLIMPKGSATS